MPQALRSWIKRGASRVKQPWVQIPVPLVFNSVTCFQARFALTVKTKIIVPALSFCGEGYIRPCVLQRSARLGPGELAVPPHDAASASHSGLWGEETRPGRG